MNNLKTPFSPISWGELIDKVTILEIKLVKIFANAKLINIQKELNYLNEILSRERIEGSIFDMKSSLKDVNLELWEIEDKLREKELINEFDEEFIQLARMVYKLNDKRAQYKLEINLYLKSEIIEEKSYKKFN